MVECLPTVSQIATFGCELDFVHPSTQKLLKDPIWDTLRLCTRFNLVVRNCFVSMEHKRQLQETSDRVCPRAIIIPAIATGTVPDNAFYSVPRVGRVLVETGIHTIGAAAWQSCHQLQLVRLPATVVCIKEGTFQGCYALTQVVAPGRLSFGRRAFAECCSLRYIGADEGETNELAPGVQISPYVFESCLALSQVDFAQTIQTVTEARTQLGSALTRGIPEGSFSSSGVEYLKFPSDFNFLGPLACENCKQLAFVDLSSTLIDAIWGSTFSHCVNLGFQPI